MSTETLASSNPAHVWTWTPTQGIRLSSALVYTMSAALQGDEIGGDCVMRLNIGMFDSFIDAERCANAHNST